MVLDLGQSVLYRPVELEPSILKQEKNTQVFNKTKCAEIDVIFPRKSDEACNPSINPTE